jgi:acyl dehydratase
VDKLRFTKPTFIGDTLYASTEIVGLRARGEQHGVATLRLDTINQRNEIVLTCEFSLLVRNQRLITPRPHAEPAAR